MRIWKYALNEGSPTILATPEEWWPVNVGYQGTQLVLWAEVEEAALDFTRTVSAIPTGASTDNWGINKLSYVGTAQSPDGLVFHIYWEPPPINIVAEANA